MNERIAPALGMTVVCYSNRAVPPNLAQITNIHSSKFVDIEGVDAEGATFNFTNINLVQSDEDAEQLPYAQIPPVEQIRPFDDASGVDDSDLAVA